MKEVKRCRSPVYFLRFILTLGVPSLMRKLYVCFSLAKLCKAGGSLESDGVILTVEMGIFCDSLVCFVLERRYFFLPSSPLPPAASAYFSPMSAKMASACIFSSVPSLLPEYRLWLVLWVWMVGLVS